VKAETARAGSGRPEPGPSQAPAHGGLAWFPLVISRIAGLWSVQGRIWRCAWRGAALTRESCSVIYIRYISLAQ
jgi:hypothetical protein